MAHFTDRSALLIRSGWLLPAAIMLQGVAAAARALGMASQVQPWLIAVSYLLLLVCTVRNLGRWGFRLFLIGLLLNMLGMASNGWRMPTSSETLLEAGRAEEAVLPSGSLAGSPKSVLLSPDATNLPFLTDVLVIPAPVRRIISIGDVVILGAVLVLLAEIIVGLRKPKRGYRWQDAI